MKLDLRYRSPVDLTQPEFQAELRRIIENSLRDFPQGADGVITLGGVEHHFTYLVHGEVVEAFVRPRNITEVAAAGIGAQAPAGVKPAPLWMEKYTKHWPLLVLGLVLVVLLAIGIFIYLFALVAATSSMWIFAAMFDALRELFSLPR